MKTILLSVSLFSLLCVSCEPDPNFPKPASSGGSSSTGTTSSGEYVTLLPTHWSFYVGETGGYDNPNNYQYALTTNSAAMTSPLKTETIPLEDISSKSRSYTLKMSASAITDTASYGYWAYSLYPPSRLHVGKSITLTAQVRLDQVQGKGVSLVLRGDRGTEKAVLLASTQDNISGTGDFTEYSVTLPYATAVDNLRLCVMMLPQTTGSVTISDVSLRID